MSALIENFPYSAFATVNRANILPVRLWLQNLLDQDHGQTWIDN